MKKSNDKQVFNMDVALEQLKAAKENRDNFSSDLVRRSVEAFARSEGLAREADIIAAFIHSA